ncbi:hypothetical protein GRX03_01655 [Halovenus sp. WSH3]|uniref:Uncharacterized protein n=1 Tax=Halovenus carboxidivorans TaxID=2692199 RepID=A0A6B0SY87_9EURY|nr:hypothetical protein [Halovenus carboxidivorans]MXR50315.1 hypothetical protein [Halovenus carboxidivorans]
MDGDRIAVAVFLLLLLGGSFLAALAALDPSLLPGAVAVYLLVASLLFLRIRRAASIWEE